MLYSVGSVLRHSLEKEYLTNEDLYTTDEHVLDLVLQHAGEDRELKKLLDRMYHRISIVHDPDRYHARVFVKSRVVDPLCYREGGVTRLSCCFTPWKTRVQEEMAPLSYGIQFGDAEACSSRSDLTCFEKLLTSLFSAQNYRRVHRAFWLQAFRNAYVPWRVDWLLKR